jgi:hypothetical protein
MAGGCSVSPARERAELLPAAMGTLGSASSSRTVAMWRSGIGRQPGPERNQFETADLLTPHASATCVSDSPRASSAARKRPFPVSFTVATVADSADQVADASAASAAADRRKQSLERLEPHRAGQSRSQVLSPHQRPPARPVIDLVASAAAGAGVPAAAAAQGLDAHERPASSSSSRHRRQRVKRLERRKPRAEAL